jgi:hypothetical protein
MINSKEVEKIQKKNIIKRILYDSEKSNTMYDFFKRSAINNNQV